MTVKTVFVTESFIQEIRSNTDSSSNETSEVLMSESLNHSFKRFVQTLIHPVMNRVKY